MDTSSSQIFQTKNPSRWQRFKWGSRIFLFLIFIMLLVAIGFKNNFWQPQLPTMSGQVAKKALQSQLSKRFFKDNSIIGKQYAGFRKYIDDKGLKQKGKSTRIYYPDYRAADSGVHTSAIRSAFYVAWDPQSFFSLRNNISHLNMVLPEWFFIDPSADTLTTNIDRRGFNIIKASGIKTVVMLSNNYRGKFVGESLHRILNDHAKKEALINSVIREVQKNRFAGVNVDFEELTEQNDEVLISFQKELYEKMHALGLMVTQDISPFNEDYNYKALSNYNDYLFLMAYDEHSPDSKPGPISSQRWIEEGVDQIAEQIPSEKIILCMAAYGYDWPVKGDDATLTYQEALSIARQSDETVDFDNDTYNLHFAYYDGGDVLHQVHFTDAATNFNTLRFATEYGLAGTALWRLGAEDSRLWDFYSGSMTKQSLSTFNFAEFNKVKSNNDVDYLGEGEVLDVLSEPKKGHITPEVDTAEMLITEETYDSLPSMMVVRKYGKPKGKEMILTFDDGPDPEYTQPILDILSKYHVPASFFLVGIEAEDHIPLVKRIYNEGHEIGNHSFTHPNMAKISKTRAFLEMDATRLLIECITGHSTVMFRAPYNADSQPETMEELIPVAMSRTRNYLTIGESIDPEDWQPGINADTIFNRVVRYQDNGNIILLHDAGGDRSATVKALPRIIEYFQKKGYVFTTVAHFLGKKKDELMPPVPPGNGYYLIEFYSFLAEVGYYGGHILYSMFMVFLALGIFRLLFMAVFAWKQHKKERKRIFASSLQTPLVSIIVPAYNEEVNAVNSLNNLLRCDYKNFNIIFIDDGSKDSTFEKVDAAFSNYPQVKVYSKPNGGKASALNFGIAKTVAEYVVCIDADTRLKPDAVRLLMQHFLCGDETSKVAAVAGNVKVGNQVNTITNWQNIEYITSQNFDRVAFAYINGITVVPGAIGAFKKTILEEAGGFTTDTLAEDCDLTIRILRLGYTIENENNAVAMTEAPETISQFLKQRLRWSFGVMQTFWKHRDALFNTNYKMLGWIALPNILLFQFIIPVFSPLADIFMLIGIFTGNAKKIGNYYLLFMLVDAAIALLAFSFEKENLKKLVWLIPQRLVYRLLMYVVLFRSYKRAIKGELQHWGVLKRTGNVKDVPMPDSVQTV